MGKVDLVQFESAEALAQRAATEWLESAALSRAQPHCAAFSGGRIAEKFFDAITAQACDGLAGVHFFWADERRVPPEHADSNYRVMREHLLEPLKIEEARVHRIKGELEPELAAREASEEFARIVRPVLDMVFLGMGEDGHIASVFPGDAVEESPGQFYRPISNAPKPPRHRVTLAMHAMVAARNVWVLVSGAGKAEALGKSLREGATPLARLLQQRNCTRIFTDIRPK